MCDRRSMQMHLPPFALRCVLLSEDWKPARLFAVQRAGTGSPRHFLLQTLSEGKVSVSRGSARWLHGEKTWRSSSDDLWVRIGYFQELGKKQSNSCDLGELDH